MGWKQTKEERTREINATIRWLALWFSNILISYFMFIFENDWITCENYVYEMFFNSFLELFTVLYIIPYSMVIYLLFKLKIYINGVNGWGWGKHSPLYPTLPQPAPSMVEFYEGMGFQKINGVGCGEGHPAPNPPHYHP